MNVEIITHKVKERFFVQLEVKELLKRVGGEHSAVFFCAVCSCSSEQRGVQRQHIKHCNRHKPSGADRKSYTRWIDTATVTLTTERTHISNIFICHLRQGEKKGMVGAKNWKSLFAKEREIVTQ